MMLRTAIFVACAFAATAGGACSTRDDGSSPESAHKTGGTRMLRPQDLVTVGWVPPAWEPAGLRTMSKSGDEAEVEVYSAAGDRQTVHLVREGKTWKVELPLR
jgi:hypothetical protein